MLAAENFTNSLSAYSVERSSKTQISDGKRGKKMSNHKLCAHCGNEHYQSLKCRNCGRVILVKGRVEKNRIA